MEEEGYDTSSYNQNNREINLLFADLYAKSKCQIEYSLITVSLLDTEKKPTITMQEVHAGVLNPETPGDFKDLSAFFNIAKTSLEKAEVIISWSPRHFIYSLHNLIQKLNSFLSPEIHIGMIEAPEKVDILQHPADAMKCNIMSVKDLCKRAGNVPVVDEILTLESSEHKTVSSAFAITASSISTIKNMLNNSEIAPSLIEQLKSAARKCRIILVSIA